MLSSYGISQAGSFSFNGRFSYLTGLRDTMAILIGMFGSLTSAIGNTHLFQYC
jgi:hypothetical protein